MRMSIVRFVATSLTAVVMSVTPIVLSASDDARTGTETSKAVSSQPNAKAPTAQFTALKSVKAVPMASRELKAVKGQHAHFWTPSDPFALPVPPEPHVVNSNNMDNWLDLGNGEIVGPGYHGLCTANMRSDAIFINPGGGC
jgi:hypothetical protein